MDTNDQPQTFEEQQAAADLGYDVAPAPAPETARADLDSLLDGRPQLASLALNLLRAVVGSGVVATPRPRVMSSVALARSIAHSERSKQHAEFTAMIEAEFPVVLQPMALALAKLADTRKAGEKAVESTPTMIRRAKAEGMKPADIARLLKVTDSHVYAVLRKAPDQETIAVEAFLTGFIGETAQFEQDQYEMRRTRVPEGRTLYEYRVELFDSSAGKGWQEHGSGDTDATSGTEAQVATDLLADAEEDDDEVRTHRARVLIWEGPAGTVGDALYFHEREPDTDTAAPSADDSSRDTK